MHRKEDQPLAFSCIGCIPAVSQLLGECVPKAPTLSQKRLWILHPVESAVSFIDFSTIINLHSVFHAEITTLFIIPFRHWLPQAQSHYLIHGSQDILVPQRSKGNFARFREKRSGAAGCADLEQISLPVEANGTFVAGIKIYARKLCCINSSDPAKGTIPTFCWNSCTKVFIAT